MGTDTAYISNISFVGNNSFDDAKLRGVVLSEETAWYKFLTPNDNYDPDRLAYDKELLRKYYINYFIETC